MGKRFRGVLRLVLPLILMVSLSTPVLSLATPAYAQDDAGEEETVTVAGSGYVRQFLYEALLDEAANPDAFQFLAEETGTDRGFIALCEGRADMTLATRPINDEEILLCEANEVGFVELVLAAEGLVMVPSAPREDVCLDVNRLDTILGVDSAGTEVVWTDFADTAEDTGPITLYGPEDSIRNLGLLSDLLPSLIEPDYRTDYVAFASPGQAIVGAARLRELTPNTQSNTVAFMSFSEWNDVEDEEGLVALDMSNPAERVICTSPTQETIANGDYPASRRLFAYVNANSLDKTGLNSFLTETLQEENAASVIDELGFTVPTTPIFANNIQSIIDRRTGRLFSRSGAPVEVNTAEPASITLNGTGLSTYASQPAVNAFNSQFPNIDVFVSPVGDAAAWRAFCSGETNLIQVTRSLAEIQAANPDDEALQNCAAEPFILNEGDDFSLFFGTEAVVFAVGLESVLPQDLCLTDDHLRQLLVQTVEDPQRGTLDSAEEETETSMNFSPDTSSQSDGIVLVQDGGEGTPPPDEENGGENDETNDEETGADGENGEGQEDGDSDEPEQEDVPLFDPENLQGPYLWSQIISELPENLELRVLTPPFSAVETDMVLSAINNTDPFKPLLRRSDAPIVQPSPAVQAEEGGDTPPTQTVEQLSDIEYRVQAINELDGGISYFMRSQLVENESLDAVRLLPVGEDCVEPTPENIVSGTYPFAVSSGLVFNEAALEDEFTAAFIWYLFSDESLETLAERSLLGFDEETYQVIQQELFTVIEETQTALAEGAEGTPPADGETTPPTDDAPPPPMDEGEDTSTTEETRDASSDTGIFGG
jgi:phosphate transport system substrate-binding protein